MDVNTVGLVAQKELRDALRNRWFGLYTLTFVALALGLSYLALSGVGFSGFAGFGRTAAGLINLTLLVVPLMALTVGATSLAAERERGTLAYLLAQPVSRAEVVAGKYLGLGAALLASLAAGFGLAGLALGLRGGAGDATIYLVQLGLAFLLALAALSIGFLISAMTERGAAAVGIALFLWLLFVFLGDLGMMGTAITMKLDISQLFWLAMTNPLQVFKLAAILNLQSTLEILGPVGTFARRTYGSDLLPLLLTTLVAWVLMPLGLAFWRFTRKDI
ncbi:MAG: ABC transporter permease [Ardenticatenaceae bacterium]|nr:ABC transporter permease [Ardenticatenaceae bacterium]HBY97484.1 ABC transporter permease [Chloroflexota bacterium]